VPQAPRGAYEGVARGSAAYPQTPHSPPEAAARPPSQTHAAASAPHAPEHAPAYPPRPPQGGGHERAGPERPEHAERGL
jgi:hypothetical protein